MTTTMPSTPTSEINDAVPEPTIFPVSTVKREIGDKQLGGEVLLTLLNQVHDPGHGSLIERVGDHANQHERQVGKRQRTTEVVGDAAAEQADEDHRKDDGEHQRQRTLDGPQHLAPGDRE
jgi:hypothetical protein